MDKEASECIRLIASVEAVLDGLKRLDQRNPAVVRAMKYLLKGIGYIGTDNATAFKWLHLCLWSLRSGGLRWLYHTELDSSARPTVIL